MNSSFFLQWFPSMISFNPFSFNPFPFNDFLQWFPSMISFNDFLQLLYYFYRFSSFPYLIVPTPSGLCIQPKFTPTYMEDDFQVNEIDMISKYIKSTDSHRRLISLFWISNRLFVCGGGSSHWFHYPSLWAFVLSLHKPPAMHVYEWS